MISPEKLYGQIVECGFTHVTWVPDSATGLLEPFFSLPGSPRLIRVCREGECFALAAGLMIGGQRPLVIVQCTGLFEAGDALRNIVHDLRMPIFFMVGYRSYEAWKRNPSNADSARAFTEPVLRSWSIPYELVVSDQDAPKIREAYRETIKEKKAGAILLGEP